MSAPTYNPNNSAAIVATPGAIAGGATAAFTMDLTAVDFGRVQIPITYGGTVGAAAGVQVGIEPMAGASPTPDTVPAIGMVVPAGAPSATVIRSLAPLPTGKYTITLTNLDTNAVAFGLPVLVTWVK